MSAALSFESEQQTLILRGELDRETLQPLWRQRDALMADKTAIDVAQLERVDSAGLALLLHLQEQQRERGVALKNFRRHRAPENADRALQPAGDNACRYRRLAAFYAALAW